MFVDADVYEQQETYLLAHTSMTVTDILHLSHHHRMGLCKRISAMKKQEAEGTYLIWT